MPTEFDLLLNDLGIYSAERYAMDTRADAIRREYRDAVADAGAMLKAMEAEAETKSAETAAMLKAIDAIPDKLPEDVDDVPAPEELDHATRRLRIAAHSGKYAVEKIAELEGRLNAYKVKAGRQATMAKAASFEDYDRLARLTAQAVQCGALTPLGAARADAMLHGLQIQAPL